MFNIQSMCVRESNMATFIIPCIRLLLCVYTSYSTLRNSFIGIIIISCKLVNMHLSVEPKWQVWDE